MQCVVLFRLPTLNKKWVISETIVKGVICMEVVENEDTKSARFYQLNELIIQKGFFGILLADIAWCLQKLGMILENKVSIKFKFLNNHFYDKMKLILYQCLWNPTYITLIVVLSQVNYKLFFEINFPILDHCSAFRQTKRTRQRPKATTMQLWWLDSLWSSWG